MMNSMQWRVFLSVQAVILVLSATPGIASETDRPLIWVKPADKPAILKKIEEHPGWHYFENVETGKQTDRAYEAVIAATELGNTPIHMRAMIPAGLATEMTQVQGPPSKGAPKGYQGKSLPAFVMRHEGEAWNNPFVAVYESYGEEPSVQTAERLMSGNVFKGVKINSILNGQDLTHYILLQENPVRKGI